jgi:REP element-mobilizing transposase RayT
VYISPGITYRRNLPHIVQFDRPLFVTFTTLDRWVLPPCARNIALRHVMFEHGRKIWVDVAVVMPDHVHVILTLLSGHRDESTLAAIMKSIKGISARNINLLLARHGSVWLDESFDHVVRATERSQAKFDYVCNNPVRAHIVKSADEYPWLWRSWIEGAQTRVSVPH